jgi:hypothetical protein
MNRRPRPSAGGGLRAAVEAEDELALTVALCAHAGPIPAAIVIHAAQRAWRPGLGLLADHGADFNASARGYRPLHALIQEKPRGAADSTATRASCLEWLVAHGADPEILGAWPQARGLVHAAFTGEPAYVATLERAGAALDLFTAAALGDAETVASRVRRDPAGATDRDQGSLTALHCCAGSRLGRVSASAARGLARVAERLVEAGADVNARVRGWGAEVTVGHLAIGADQVDLVSWLLARGLDATSAIPSAAWKGRPEVLDRLLAAGGQIDGARAGDRPILNELVRWGQFAAVRLLLARGANPNLPDPRGWTAVHQAVSRGNVRGLSDLLEAGGDPLARDREGRTPRDLAAQGGRRDLVPLLHGCPPSPRGRPGPTAT